MYMHNKHNVHIYALFSKFLKAAFTEGRKRLQSTTFCSLKLQNLHVYSFYSEKKTRQIEKENESSLWIPKQSDVLICILHIHIYIL